MKLVTFSKAQAPHGVGDTRLVSDAVAAKLRKEGVVSSAEAWPPAASRPQSRQVPAPTRPIGQSDNRKAE